MLFLWLLSRLFPLLLLLDEWLSKIIIQYTCRSNVLASILHYDDVIMGAMASQITSLTIVYSTVYSDADQRKHQSSAPLAFVRGIHRGPVNSPHKWPVTRKMFPFHDVIMGYCRRVTDSNKSVTPLLQKYLYNNKVIITACVCWDDVTTSMTSWCVLGWCILWSWSIKIHKRTCLNHNRTSFLQIWPQCSHVRWFRHPHGVLIT